MASAPEAEQGVSELVHSLTEDLRQLVTDEVALARAELGETLRRALRALIGALAALLGAAVMLGFALVTLVEWLPNHTLVAGLVAAAGLLLVAAGAATLFVNRRLIPFVITRRSLQEDLEWARQQSRRARR